MKFGKEFKTHLEETIPEWRDKFLCYKPLKKLLKHHLPSATNNNNNNTVPITLHLLQQPPSPQLVQAWFVRILNEELEKFNDFYVDKEEEFVIRFQVLLNFDLFFFFFFCFNMCYVGAAEPFLSIKFIVCFC